MYKIIATISILIRQFCLPNPCGNISFNFKLHIGQEIINIPFLIPPVLANAFVAEPILQTVTFGIVGIYYKRRSNPAIGSILYLVLYSVHVWLLIIMKHYNWAAFAIVIISTLYIGVHIFIILLFNKTKYYM